MPFEERYELLLASGQASPETIQATRLALKLVEARYGIVLTEETGAMLATHLAVTLRRLREGEVLGDVPPVMWQELQTVPDALAFASSLIGELEAFLGAAIPPSEAGFLAIHLARIEAMVA